MKKSRRDRGKERGRQLGERGGEEKGKKSTSKENKGENRNKDAISEAHLPLLIQPSSPRQQQLLQQLRIAEERL